MTRGKVSVERLVLKRLCAEALAQASRKKLWLEDRMLPGSSWTTTLLDDRVHRQLTSLNTLKKLSGMSSELWNYRTP